MARNYTLRRRAEQQAETRRRIVEAAVELHSDLGPARTTLSMVAERAGVQRNTLYAHFPDERSLQLACSALALEREPPPAAGAWREFVAKGEQLNRGLRDVYGWYERTEGLTACVLRDAEHHAVTRETAELRLGPVLAAWHEVLGDGLTERQRAMLHLALAFHSWRALVREAGLTCDEAAATLARAIVGADST